MVISACAELTWHEIGCLVHGLVLKHGGFERNCAVGASFVYFYSKCGFLEDARNVFDEMPERDVFAWTAVINGHVQNGESERGIEYLRKMHSEGDKEAWNTMVKGYGKMKLLLGKSLHCYAVKTSFDLATSVVNSLIDLYGKMGDLTVAWRMFSEADKSSVVTWNSMIASYVHCERSDKAIALFDRMISENFKPSSITLVTVLMACANTGSLEKGDKIHRYITETEQEMSLSLTTALIDMMRFVGT
ncbi:BnaA01g34600D [Brassica napus]|uniref:BnaA01g34600D protein n=1 Tax=Brassica napus TaxID=3708 RepID=A0A078JEX7_BRANA|nr:BnaA01g34600D [Brassica napus]